MKRLRLIVRRTRDKIKISVRCQSHRALTSKLWLASYMLVVACQCATSKSYAAEAQAGSEDKFVSGRLALGALVDSSYSGAAGYKTYPIPLASVDFGDRAYIDYWQAGLYVFSNHDKTLGLAVVATPRLGFSSRDGPRLSGMATRKSSIESGLSIEYGSGSAGVSLGYLHDVTRSSDGDLIRLLAFKRIDVSTTFGVDAFVGMERLSARMANYYYGIRNNETTAARPYYQPGMGTDLSAGLHFNFDFGQKSTILFGYEVARLGATLAQSPIVERRITNLVYLGYGLRL